MKSSRISVPILCFYSYALTLSVFLIYLKGPSAIFEAGVIMFLAWLAVNRRLHADK